MKIGVLSLQGGVAEHIKQINSLGYNAIEVKKKEDLDNIQAIILPGGESTTMGRLLKVTKLLQPLKEKIKMGLPTWGTCAGMILLAKEICDYDTSHLALMNIKVKRNGFGSQINSFIEKANIKAVASNPVELVFIRAPYVSEIGDNVEVICKIKDKIVAVKENNMLATSFHPELTMDATFLKYFIDKFINI